MAVQKPVKELFFKYENRTATVNLDEKPYKIENRKLQRRLLRRLKLDPKEVLKKPDRDVTRDIMNACGSLDKTLLFHTSGDTVVNISVVPEKKSKAE